MARLPASRARCSAPTSGNGSAISWPDVSPTGSGPTAPLSTNAGDACSTSSSDGSAHVPTGHQEERQMLNEPTLEKLKSLRLDAMAAAWNEQQKNAEHSKLSFDERFGMLV